MPHEARAFAKEVGTLAGPTRPTARKIALGQELRRLRVLSGMRIEDAAVRVGFSEAMLQRIETGLSAPRLAQHLTALLEVYGIEEPNPLVEELLAIQREASSQEWISEFKDGMTPTQMPKFVGIEEVAKTIRAYHPLLPWGSLQTEPFARALFAMQQPVLEAPSESVEKAVQLRMRRRGFITRAEDPVALVAIIGESALRQVIGDIDVMQEQCAELIKLSKLDNVTIQILPTTGKRYRFTADFSILDMGDELPPQVQADNAWGALAMSGKPRDVGVFTRRFERLTASALPPEETEEYVRNLAREIK
ncbi:helix-turn-helix domain-containing protein [Streptomyces sp. OfavH-34-F]|uniref:helix-turn-helix domain-containing protein n=1 Tax=Streptomyces sp. OfavH-34-F TaxID=2917760 RepID=UPI001EF27EAC|nr:helix-turn-helix transcriptional regulator [Streptomyces sp. OfavH-34-F]MCG7523840.1 helix-turn-helix domain-containing protein [Streptomyces sp. OfavH-34-F]